MKRNFAPPIRRVLRLVGWNVFLLVAGLALVLSAAEVWLRMTTPFVGEHFPSRFVPNVGPLTKPNVEVRRTNGLDFWTVSRTNSLGFLDREPISPERAAASCHIAMIGDSFVEASEVAIADKFHVRLEALAAQELPHLAVTTSAFGRSATGQINQLAFYDEYARYLHPKIVVLVVVDNDFQDNSTIFNILHRGFHPERMPFVSARRGEDGRISLRPSHPDYLTFKFAQGTGLPESIVHPLKKGWDQVRGTFYFLDWLYAKAKPVFLTRLGVSWRGRKELLNQVSPRATPSSGSTLPTLGRFLNGRKIPEEDRDIFPQDALEMMNFALNQFKERAERDGFSLMILSTYTMSIRDRFFSDKMSTLAHARRIPTIDFYDYVTRRGNRVDDAHWPHDWHWNPAGHQWAAESLLEYLQQHPEICDKPGTKEPS